MDRNSVSTPQEKNIIVALLAEGVDRNLNMASDAALQLSSPSSRRAWIEIGQPEGSATENEVALLAEGVDRNPREGSMVPAKLSRPPRGGRG